jgi:hypothetical protein
MNKIQTAFQLSPDAKKRIKRAALESDMTSSSFVEKWATGLK